MLKYCISLLLILTLLNCRAQSIQYAREVVDELCKPELHGRGYVNEGDRKAAAYIAGEFERMGVEKAGNSYFQHFPLDVNIFPGRMSVELDGEKLKPGEDYLIDPCSPGIKGKYSISENVEKDQVLMVPSSEQWNFRDSIFSEKSPAAIIKLTDKKLTWHISTKVCQRPVIYLREELYHDQQQIKLRIESRYLTGYTTQNVIGMLPGQQTDTFVVFTAHYDHLGRMGKETYFPGANDNASGVAMLLSMAEYYKKQDRKYSILFIATGAEETGLIGSSYFVKNPLVDLSKIKFLVNFDIVGTGDDGITVVNGKVYEEKFEELSRLNKVNNYLPAVKSRGEACNSDHCLFHLSGVPSFYIYTMGGIQAYHDIHDRASTLPLTEFMDYHRLVTGFIDQL